MIQVIEKASVNLRTSTAFTMVKQLNYKVEITPHEFPVDWEPLIDRVHFFQHLVWCNIRKIQDEGRKIG